MENPNFLKKRYNLHSAPETELAANRTEKRSKEKVPQSPDARIQNYLDRFKEVIERKDPKEREMGMQALKKVLHDKFVIKPAEIPDGYFENQQRIAREQGHGDIEITDEMRRQHSEVIIADQESSLDKWINYLSSEDATYPDWLKYYAVRSVLGMSTYDKEKKSFTKRTKETVAPFPDLNREALAYVLDAIEKKQTGVKTIPPIDVETDEKEYEKFEKLIQGENFAKLYAWAIEKVTPDSKDLLTNTEGEWIKYDQGSDHMPLVQSLQGHGTGWCTAGESTAQTQLEMGELYIYYSYDEKGQSTIPRAAIRTQEGQIAEVRGVAHDQNLDPYISDVVKEKLTEFHDGKNYAKKTEDMKLLTDIEKKVNVGQILSKEDLIFLYEVNSEIEGFGYEKDPRISEIIKTRNKEEDALVIFDCSSEEIANSETQITEKTKVFIGILTPEIFDLINKYNIEHIYTSFPEGKIQRFNVKIGGKDKDQLIQELKAKNSDVSEWALELLESEDFTTSENIGNINLISLTAKDLRMFKGTTTKRMIYQYAEQLGLELCPPEVGLYLGLQYSGYKEINIAIESINDRNGLTRDVFSLPMTPNPLDQVGIRQKPSYTYSYDSIFVFRLPKRADESDEKNKHE